MILVSACLAGVECRYDGRHNLVNTVELLVKKGKAVLVCPEQLGGLSTPRLPAEIVGGTGDDVLDGRARVVDIKGNDVTDQFLKGAEQTLKIAQFYGATKAVLKESSPSCGSNMIYDGTFKGKKMDGFGVTTALLRRHGIEVISEKELHEYLERE